jgi:hypothetical protein
MGRQKSDERGTTDIVSCQTANVGGDLAVLACIAVTAFLTSLGVYSHGKNILVARKVGLYQKLDSASLHITTKSST